MGRTLFWAAAVVGCVHAAASAYWALGGRWLLNTVGSWAVDAATTAPLLASLVLGVVALAKVAAAVIPLLVEYGRIGATRFWRGVSWIGGIGLILYGGTNTVVAAAVLAGVIHSDGGYDEAAMIGHASLWDPLFLVWGLSLTAALLLTRSADRL